MTLLIKFAEPVSQESVAHKVAVLMNREQILPSSFQKSRAANAWEIHDDCSNVWMLQFSDDSSAMSVYHTRSDTICREVITRFLQDRLSNEFKCELEVAAGKSADATQIQTTHQDYRGGLEVMGDIVAAFIEILTD